MVEGSVGRPCEEVVQGLRDQVATIPDVRTVNLARGEVVYCTSLYGSYHGPFKLADYANGQLDLMRGNPVTPDRPLVVYRQPVGEYSVLVGVDGYYLHNILDMLSRNSPLTLVIGAQSMLANGQIHDEVPPVVLGSLEQVSGKYPFRVVTELSYDEYGSHIWTYSRASLIIYPLLGLVVGCLVYWLTGRSSELFPRP